VFRIALLSRLRLDPFIMALLTTVGIATLLPARGGAVGVFDDLSMLAVGLLFFLYGTRLSADAMLTAVRHWRLHAVVLVSTFVLFPLLGLAASALTPTVLTPSLYAGVLFLCTLPSTVQSSIAFTSIAGGNVPAAICSASLSNLIGTLLTPLLVGLLLTTNGAGFSARSLRDIALQLLLPFLVGQVLRRWIGTWVQRHRKVLGLVDRGSILLVVYTAFSAGVVAGIWHQLSAVSLATLLAVTTVLLAAVLTATTLAARYLGFDTPDRVAIVFCGSKKSLAAGLPMATVLFAGQNVGLIVLPLMLFHQVQLMVCAALARRYAVRIRDYAHRTATELSAPEKAG
jgi:solute carrier family 10 (sodium/bile acid cotransporter), member 7